MNVAERLDVYGRATCPWCGNDRETIFVRAVPGDRTSPLVCRSPHFPRHRFDRWKSWATDLEIDRFLEEQI